MTQTKLIAKQRYEGSHPRDLKEGRLAWRDARRFHFDWEVRVRGLGPADLGFDEQAELTNLSSSGVFLHLTRSLKLGARLEIWLKIPFKKNNWIIYSGETVRVQSALRRVGVAVRFDTTRPRFR